ncbi:MAG TPA: cytochrome c oxidase subunit II [Solirubrobacterales bacterium]|nr:cytochrome c oxidase subunit II [Solirubrobacterales bacterium]
MAPHSPGTDQIDTLLWIGLVAAAIVVLAVLGALLYALRRFRAERGAEPRQLTGDRRIQLRVGGVLAAFATVLLVVGIAFTEKAREAPASGPAGLHNDGETLQIKATGQQWLWRYDYPNEAFSYYKLVVPVDTAVELDLVSTDVVHTWDVPSLAGKADAVPGKTNQVRFSADEEGAYSGQSATLSGQGYPSMRTEVEVVSPEEYETFVKQRKSDIEAAQEKVVELIEGGDTS